MRNCIKTSLVIAIILACVGLFSAQEEPEHHCVWYGVCNFDGTHSQNCPYDGPGKPLNQSDEVAIEIMQRRCPEYYTSPDSLVCCTEESLKIMDASIFNAEAIFGRCPTCLKNLIRSICAFSCNNQASKFVTRHTTTNVAGVEYINALDFRGSEEYFQGVFDSCVQIVHPSSGKKALDLACGSYEADKCTPMRWFTFMGDKNANPLAPFQITYHFSEDPNDRFEYPTKTCDEAYEGDHACSCVDCPGSCPAGGEFFEEESMFSVGPMNGISFIIGILIGVVGVVYLTTYFSSNIIRFRGLSAPSWASGTDRVNHYLTKFFQWWGEACAKNSVLTIALCSYVVAALGYGIFSMIIIVDPVELWASPTSQSRVDKDYFDSRFGPFYRTEQIFFKPYNQEFFEHVTYNGNITFGPALRKDFLLEVFALQTAIEQLGVEEGEGLDKICFAPVVYPGQVPTLLDCTVQSIFGYFDNSLFKFNSVTTDIFGFEVNYLDTIIKCSQNSYNIDCLAPYGGPVEAGVAFGGMPKPAPGESANYKLATGLVVSFMVNNKQNKSELGPALAWEKRFIDHLKAYKSDIMDIAFSAERSIEDGIEELSNAETGTVIISYAVMFIYITIALGKFKGFRTLLLESKIVLGTGGIVVVLAAVVCSLGIFGYLGVSTTMLTIEVIPFLVLAIGVDNIFIFVHAYNRIPNKSSDNIEQNIGKALGQVGPSILLCTSSEILCFAIGSLSEMPAVNTFAMYAAVAVFLAFVFQTTAFVALMCIDQKRYQQNRLDLLCCVKQNRRTEKSDNDKGLLQKLVEDYYTPLIMKKGSHLIVLIIFTVFTSFSIMAIPTIEPGLDQELSMAKDSHVVKYFRFMADILSIGPPVYWIVSPGLDYMDPSDQNYICGGIMCNTDSLSTKLYLASNYPDITYIARPSSSWIDDYIDWITVGSCCRITDDGEFCPSNNMDCDSCIRTLDGVRPSRESFEKYFEFYLSDLPDENCAKAGRAAYAAAINYFFDENGNLTIGDTYFMSYHTTLITSKEFYTALTQARVLADDINDMFEEKGLDIHVRPYSIFYVFYEQYLTIWRDSLLSLTYSLLSVCGVTFIVTGFNFIFALVVTFFVLLILINMGGVMWLWGITLNAVSLVNLVVSVGIGVEFISHIVRAYTTSVGSKRQRAENAMVTTGSSVLSGITLTKFAGILVLAFAKSQIFQVFYFRMYLSIVILGAAHGLLLLPVFLCYIGPPSKQTKPEFYESMQSGRRADSNGLPA